MKEIILRVTDKEYQTYFKQDPHKAELTRCKDCTWWIGGVEECRLLQEYFGPEEYCSMADRKESDATEQRRDE